MSASSSAPGTQQGRFAAYLDRLAQAAEHADRDLPLRNYCTGLLLPGERKSVEPMAARLAPDKVRQMHQSLHHLVADSAWSDEEVMNVVREYVLLAMKRQGPVQAWIVDDTGFVKKGTHSVGVARQYCGSVGKQENCRVAVSLSVATEYASVPIAWRLYLPEMWVKDKKRRKKTGVPEPISFQTKPEIAWEQIRKAVQEEVPTAPVLADAAYGNDTEFRERITELGLPYVVGIQGTTSVWGPGEAPLPKKRWTGRGRPPKLLQRGGRQQPVSVKEIALSWPSAAWRTIRWREGTRRPLSARFTAVRVRPAHRDYWRSQPHPEEWLLIEWPVGEPEPTKYWLSTLSRETPLRPLVRLAKHRWIIERDYQELKQELGLGHYEGRGWRGFHHHATLCIAAYGFLVAERSRFSPSARVGHVGLPEPKIREDFTPRGAPRSPRAA
jgi:SRSO17 transposase